jgi:vacuolar-type H+-ATPase subunit E/Vma4
VATPNQDSQRALCDEILAEAHCEGEQIVRTARQEAETLLARATDEAKAARQQRLDLARAEAARRRELLLATVPLETGRLRSARIETLLHSIYEGVRQRLLTREGFDYREALITLAAEAAARMAGDAFVVKLSAADRAALGEGLAEEIAQRVGHSPALSITISDEPAITEGGLLIEDSEGRQVWDNRLPARLERLWPELRRQIALGASLVSKDSSAGGSA